MEYKKLNIPLRERLTFLFTGLLAKKYLTGISNTQSKQEEQTDINNIEEVNTDLSIPFFDLDNSDTKSNL